MRLTTSTLVIGVLALVGAPLSRATTPPALKLSDTAGDSVTIDSTGAGTVTCVGTCSTTLGPIVSPGSVVWGALLAFSP